MTRQPIESEEEKRDRHEACDALRVPRNTRRVTCPIHGQSASIRKVYEMNIGYIDENDGIRCEPSHPYCFGWAERQ